MEKHIEKIEKDPKSLLKPLPEKLKLQANHTEHRLRRLISKAEDLLAGMQSLLYQETGAYVVDKLSVKLRDVIKQGMRM